jgi:dUTP pyrophosphatase
MTYVDKVKITVTDKALIPTYSQPGDAGADLRAAHGGIIYPGERKLVMTGVKLALPDNVVALVHPRSGLALKQGLTVLNAPGTIDSNYRGEIGVILYNSDSDRSVEIEIGDRIAQLVFQEVLTVEFEQVESLDETNRGEGGFGSTGVKN